MVKSGARRWDNGRKRAERKGEILHEKGYSRKQKTNDYVSIVTLAVVDDYGFGGKIREI